MGFQAGPRRYKLIFDDPELKGLEVTATSFTLGELVDLGGGNTGMNQGQLFSEHLVEWNVEDDGGKPVEASYDELLKLDGQIVNRIVAAWMKTITGVPDPLDEPSASPGSEAESLDLASASQSLQS